MTKVRESVIEEYLRNRCDQLGYLCYKFKAPSNAGVPDRIVIGNGHTVFVELKRPGEKPRKLQVAQIRRMREAGATVFVADTTELVDEVLQYVAKDN